MSEACFAAKSRTTDLQNGLRPWKDHTVSAQQRGAAHDQQRAVVGHERLCLPLLDRLLTWCYWGRGGQDCPRWGLPATVERRAQLQGGALLLKQQHWRD